MAGDVDVICHHRASGEAKDRTDRPQRPEGGPALSECPDEDGEHGRYGSQEAFERPAVCEHGESQPEDEAIASPSMAHQPGECAIEQTPPGSRDSSAPVAIDPVTADGDAQQRKEP